LINTKIIKYLLFLVTITFISNAKAQMIFDTLLLNEFEVIGNIEDFSSATKTVTIDSIARKELNLQDIGELLAAFTPVFVKSYGKGSLSTVSFRGTGASHTKVLWEGININSPMLGQTDFSLLPGFFFDEVELQYGGGSLHEVSGAIGGSIDLKSRGVSADNTVDIIQSIGSYGTYYTSASVNIHNQKIYSTTRFIRQSSLNNFTYLNNAILPDSKEMTQENADFVNIGFTQQISYNVSNKQQVSFITWNQWNKRNVPTIMANVEKGGNQKESNNDFFSRNVLKWVLHNDKSTWNAKASYLFEELNYFLKTENEFHNPISIIDSQNKVESYSFEWAVSFKVVETLNLKIGMEMLQQNVVSSNYTGRKQRNVLSNYASFVSDINKKITTELLVRYELSDAKSIPLMPMFGVNYKPFSKQNLHFRANISRNYNRPSLNDLYWYPGGNSDLKPEKSLESEIGINYIKKQNDNINFTVAGSAYASYVSDWIIWLPSDYRYWSPENIAKVYARGYEASIKIVGKLRKVKYSLFTEYAYTRTTNNSDSAIASGLSDIQLIYIPKHTVVGYFNISTVGYYLNWSLSYTGIRNTSLNGDEYYSNKLPSYLLNNISVGKKLKLMKADVDIRVKVYNIFNIDYQAVLWRAMPGRNFEVSLSIKL